MKYLSKSLGETNKIAEGFISQITGVKRNKALIIGLFGDLGSGKTTFTQAIGKILGVKEIMTSPTFVIEKIYSLSDTGKLLENPLHLTRTNRSEEFPKAFGKLIHIDAYRLDSSQELLSLKFAEIQKDPNNLILIEWPEKVSGILPDDLIKVKFKFISEFEREIEI